MVTNLELGWSKLMHILARGHPHLSPKCKTRKRDSDKSSSHLHHFLSSSIFKIDLRLFEKHPSTRNLDRKSVSKKMLDAKHVLVWPPRNPLLRTGLCFSGVCELFEPQQSSPQRVACTVLAFCYFKNQFAMKHTAHDLYFLSSTPFPKCKH